MNNVTKAPGRSKKGIVFALIAVLFVAALLAFRILSSFETHVAEEESPINVRLANAEHRSIHATAPISGRVAPIEEVSVAPLASGEITRVNVKVGDFVKKGAVLFEIDRTQLSTSYNQAKEALNAAQAHYDRMNLLHAEGAVSLQALEQAQTQYATTREIFTAASSAYSNTTVTAPIGGYITYLTAVAGGIAAPGVPAAIVADVSKLEISTSVSEYIVGKLKIGDPVEIHISTLGSGAYQGMIKAITPAPAGGGLTYPITVSVEDESGEVMAGMFAEIRIISDEKDDALCVPSDAVIIKSGRSIVIVVGGDSIAEFREVVPGIDNGEFVEIISGLSPGEAVAVSGQQYAKEGRMVNVIE